MSRISPAETRLPFADAYRRALADYVIAGTGEEALMLAYELGRRAVSEERNILDLVALHQNSMLTQVLHGAAEKRTDIYLSRSQEFLAEVLAPFEMMHRGFVDTIHQLQEANATLEQRVHERTRSLLESQQKTADLARLYAILSSINSAIVRLSTRTELFKEVCRIAVNQGGYPVAWITLRSAAGQDQADVWCHRSSTGVSCKSTKDGPVFPEIGDSIEHVYNVGKPIIVHQGSKVPATLNRTPADYSASALLPLLLEGRVAGVFILMSAEMEAFNQDEMRLLLEMSGDLSFALDHIQKDEQINYLAYYDALTGLPNRGLLQHRLPLQLQAAGQTGTIVAMLLVDLVHFSDVNDTYGRHSGDSLLKQVANRLCQSTGDCKTVARLGADRFALSLADMGDMHQVAHTLEQEVLADFLKPFRVNEIDIHLTAQVGISLFPSDATDAETLFKNAEIALKRAQTKGDSYLFYNPEMNERIIHSVTMESKLRKAVQQGGLVLHYQPKISTASGRLVGMEALLRYVDPETGVVLPDRFIALTEKTGLIIEIGNWVIRRALEDLDHWRRLNIAPPRIAVNVSPIQLRQKNFIPSLRELLRDTAGRSDGLDIEITESAVMEEVEENISRLEAIREMGFRIAIDDFGTGYSSLNYLSQLPVNTLKIDRSFIVDMTERSNSLSIVTTIITLAHALGLEVVAEGVEKEEQAKLLKLLRCDTIQGNLYSQPLQPEQIISRLRQEMATTS